MRSLICLTTVLLSAALSAAPTKEFKTSAEAAAFDWQAFAKAFAGEKLAASVEFRPDRLADAPIGFGFALRSMGPLSEAALDFSVATTKGTIGPGAFLTGFDATMKLGEWHQVAWVWTKATDTVEVFFDGEKQTTRRSYGRETTPAGNFFKPKFADAQFPGEVRNYRVWAGEPDGDFLVKPRLAVEPPAWTKPGAKLTPCAIRRFHDRKHVPYRMPDDASELKELRVAAALGEIECGSFLVYPSVDAADFHVTATDLKGPDGATYPAKDVDIRVVKNWYQTRWGWTTFYMGGLHVPSLCPELLLHDDAMVRNDRGTRTSYLRLSPPSGERYVSVSTFGDAESVTPFDYNIEPVRDAETFRPMALEGGRLTQLWITLRVPEDAKAGDYSGELRLTLGGKVETTVPLRLAVRPFRLPRPATHHNIDRPFLGTWMHHCNLVSKLAGGKESAGGCNLTNALRRLENEYRNMVEHNMAWPWAPCWDERQAPAAEEDEDPILYDLAAYRRAGCEMKPYFGSPGISWEFMLWPQYPPDGITNMSVEANYDFWSKEMVAYTNRLERLMPFIDRHIGHRELVYYAFDEASPECVRRDMPFFATVNHFGGLTFTTSGIGSEAAFITDYNDAPSGYNRDKSREWHEAGGLIANYASPHAGQENPDIYRRHKGLGSYFADLDGVNEYVWYEGRHIWNEFLQGNEYRNFCMVYPTADGVVDTVQWEALREGMDDIRYLTLLRRLARAAIRTGKPALVKDGKRLTAWAEMLDWRTVDLEEMRETASGAIVALRGALRKEGVDVESFVDAPQKPRMDVVLAIPRPRPGMDGKTLIDKAKRFSARNMADVAAAFYEAAAKTASGDVRAELFVKAAGEVKRYRDFVRARALYAQAAEAEGASLLVQTKCRLLSELVALEPDVHGWTLDPKVYADVKKRTLDVLSTSGRHLAPDDVVGARTHLMRAALAAGVSDDAVAMAEAILAYKPYKGAEGRFEAMKTLAEALGRKGLWKKSADAWEKAAGMSGSTRLECLVRLGEAAQECKDYVRAMSAYTEALKCIDKKEQAAKYGAMVARVAEMSRYIGKQSKPKAGADFMSSESDDVSDISLDE